VTNGVDTWKPFGYVDGHRAVALRGLDARGKNIFPSKK
jgi:hypothetical protein